MGTPSPGSGWIQIWQPGEVPESNSTHLNSKAFKYVCTKLDLSTTMSSRFLFVEDVDGFWSVHGKEVLARTKLESIDLYILKKTSICAIIINRFISLFRATASRRAMKNIDLKITAFLCYPR